MEQAAIARPDVADLVKAAIEALAKARFELPALSTLRRLAASIQEKGAQRIIPARERSTSTGTPQETRSDDFDRRGGQFTISTSIPVGRPSDSQKHATVDSATQGVVFT